MPDFLKESKSYAELRKSIYRLSKYMQKYDSKRLFDWEAGLIQEAIDHPEKPLYTLLMMLHDDIDLKISQSMFQNTILKSIALENRESFRLLYFNHEELSNIPLELVNEPVIIHFDYTDHLDFPWISQKNPKTFFVMSVSPADIDFDFLLDTVVCPNIAYAVRAEDCSAEEVLSAIARLHRIDLLSGIEIILPNESKSEENLHELSKCGCMFIIQSQSAAKTVPLNEETVSIALHEPILIVDRM